MPAHTFWRRVADPIEGGWHSWCTALVSGISVISLLAVCLSASTEQTWKITQYTLVTNQNTQQLNVNYN